ncbi:MAG TPA: hypothetical protein VEY07_03445 [Thermoplasmata archaeon]|nr:hypothetical protein [Thermoplasmata archaeon]
MNLDRIRWVLLVVAGVLGALAAYAGSNESTAVPLAVGAVVAGGVFAALSLVEHVRFHLPTIERPEVDSLVALRRAFAEGAIGRQRIAQALLELERETYGRTSGQEGDPTALSPESVSEPEFRRWVVARLDRLEATT